MISNQNEFIYDDNYVDPTDETNDLDIHLVANDFFDKAVKLRGMAKSTVEAYTRDYNDLIHYLDTRHLSNDVKTIKSDVLEDFFAYVKGRGVGVNTLNRKKHALSSLFYHAEKRGWIDHNPINSVTLSRRKKIRRVVFLSIEDTNHFLTSVVNVKGYSFLTLATAKITLVFTGMRRSEIINLNWDHVDFESNTIKVYNTKNTNKKNTLDGLDREIPICTTLKDSLIEISKSGKTGPVFKTTNGQRITKDSLVRLVKRSAHAANINCNLSPHGLRHNFASHLEKLGATQSDISFLLGHMPDSTTQGYVHSDLNRARELVEIFYKEIMINNESGSDTETLKIEPSSAFSSIKECPEEQEFFTVSLNLKQISEIEEYWNRVKGKSPMTVDFLLGALAAQRRI